MFLPSPVSFVLARLRDCGFPAYAVGGCVRDWLMGRAPGDYDVTTAARPDDMLRVFSDCRVVETGLKHGTLTVVLDGMNVEVTTYRIDGTYSDGRRPDSVAFSDRLADDLCRRDFTVNAMAWSPEDGLVDLFGGREDLGKKVIRCVGRARDRFSEDGLRILRALRFASTLGFSLDPECAEAVFALAPMLDHVSRERIHAELTKLLAGQNASAILEGFAPVLASVLPPLTAEEISNAAAFFRDHAPEDTGSAPVRLALLLDGRTPDDASRILDSLKPSRDEKRAVLRLLENRGFPDAGPDLPMRLKTLRLMRDCGDGFPSDLARTLRLTGRAAEDFAALLDAEAEKILTADACRRTSQLKVDGRDLAAEGFSGPAIGETLRLLLDEVLEEKIPNERSALLSRARALRRPAEPETEADP